jgi:hypothetical protein
VAVGGGGAHSRPKAKQKAKKKHQLVIFSLKKKTLA